MASPLFLSLDPTPDEALRVEVWCGACKSSTSALTRSPTPMHGREAIEQQAVVEDALRERYRPGCPACTRALAWPLFAIPWPPERTMRPEAYLAPKTVDPGRIEFSFRPHFGTWRYAPEFSIFEAYGVLQETKLRFIGGLATSSFLQGAIHAVTQRLVELADEQLVWFPYREIELPQIGDL